MGEWTLDLDAVEDDEDARMRGMSTDQLESLVNANRPGPGDADNQLSLEEMTRVVESERVVSQDAHVEDA